MWRYSCSIINMSKILLINRVGKVYKKTTSAITACCVVLLFSDDKHVAGLVLAAARLHCNNQLDMRLPLMDS